MDRQEILAELKRHGFGKTLMRWLCVHDEWVKYAEHFGARGNDRIEAQCSHNASRAIRTMRMLAQREGYKPEITMIHMETVYQNDMPDVRVYEMEAF